MRLQVLFFLLVALFVASAPAQQDDSAPVTCTQFVAWTAGGMSNPRLDRLAHLRGTTFTPDEATSRSLSAAGVDPALLRNLPAPASGKLDAADCPSSLVQAAELIHQKKFQEAQSILQKMIAADSDNAALHFAMGYVHQQQEDWDEASDSYTNSEALMPGLSDVHSRMAYLLYRSDDADGAIAEARTALSIDPRNAEGYRFLRPGFVRQRPIRGSGSCLPGVPRAPARQR